jgi:hypothetical protein
MTDTDTATNTKIEYTLDVFNREYTYWDWQRAPPFKTRPQAVSPPTTACGSEPRLETGLKGLCPCRRGGAEPPAEPPLYNISPIKNKLFHGDRVDEHGKLISSPYREATEIGGVLLVADKTYGRVKEKLLYKCIPYEKNLPCFLIPYEDRSLGFSKLKQNKYITFKLKEWTDKHPHGILTNTFGNVNDVDAYANYQMHCQKLNNSIKTLNTATLRALREDSILNLPIFYKEEYKLEDRRTHAVFSIDPANCNDIDDALGISRSPIGETILSIYIANVPLVLEHLELWTYLSDRISTIYLPGQKIPMLPAALSENKCSLLQGQERVAFVMDVYIYQGRISNIICKTVFMQVSNNYVYEDKALLARPDYQEIFKVVKWLNEESSTYLGYVDQVNNSHDVVEFCMILMNYECSKILKAKRKGIFRTATKKELSLGAESAAAYMASDLKYILQGTVGAYCGIEDLKPHEIIGGGVDSYLHITSPIRRIVDCINMLEIMSEDYVFSKEADLFKEKWMANLTLINANTKAIRHLQNDMALLHMYEKNTNKDQIYSGVVLGVPPPHDGMGAAPFGFERVEPFGFERVEPFGFERVEPLLYKYRVYIYYIKLLTNVYSTKKVENYTTMNFTIHLFLDEVNMTKKIRLQML